jgi:hypothetical protein
MDDSPQPTTRRQRPQPITMGNQKRQMQPRIAATQRPTVINHPRRITSRPPRITSPHNPPVFKGNRSRCQRLLRTLRTRQQQRRHTARGKPCTPLRSLGGGDRNGSASSPNAADAVTAAHHQAVDLPPTRQSQTQSQDPTTNPQPTPTPAQPPPATCQ